MSQPSVAFMLAHFVAYMQQWQQLEREYYRIPRWRTFKQLQNIRQREKLTKLYVARAKKWGIL